MAKLIIRTLIIVLFSGFILAGCAPKWEIKNPYENVDWENHIRAKANLHTHTTRSDGRMSPQEVVDSYQKLGYKILALTDHNEVTFPWIGFSELNPSRRAFERLENGEIDSSAVIYQNRNPKEMDMFAIQSNEVSAPHHIGSFFNDYQEQPGDEKIAIQEIGKLNGLTLLNHPGRYTARNPEKYTVSWYIDIFKSYDIVTGMEVYNQGDRYTKDRILWDSLLIRTMPERPIWGYSNDDFHSGMERLGRNWNVFLLSEINEESVRTGMLNGNFFYVYAANGHTGSELPQLKSVDVNEMKSYIEINVTGADSIRWISAGKVICRDAKINLSEISELQNYVRSEIYGGGAVIGLQPFALIKK